MGAQEATVPTQTKGSLPRYTVGEEVANAVSHGVGCGLSIAALVLLVVRAVHHGAGVHLTAALFMGITLIMEYLFSTLYHAIQPPRAKAILRILDHVGIFLLIAGSYAPFALVTLEGHGGLRLFVFVGTVALAGAITEAFLQERQPGWLSTALYLAMGWVVMLHVTDVIELLPSPAFRLLVAGGLCYTTGVIFYAMTKVRYMHFVFHLFVLAGSVCITLSALLFVI
ncbi:MAG: hemolysin III family protein [Coriobacteriales bacterium]|nr:hemolysin III family protein [Coriobacteriales bacterium]